MFTEAENLKIFNYTNAVQCNSFLCGIKKTLIHLKHPYQDSIACVMVLLTRKIFERFKI